MDVEAPDYVQPILGLEPNPFLIPPALLVKKEGRMNIQAARIGRERRTIRVEPLPKETPRKEPVRRTEPSPSKPARRKEKVPA